LLRQEDTPSLDGIPLKIAKNVIPAARNLVIRVWMIGAVACFLTISRHVVIHRIPVFLFIRSEPRHIPQGKSNKVVTFANSLLCEKATAKEKRV
jgi:hypothetical protein